MAQRGRPPKSEDPPVTRSFDFPAKLNTELIATSRDYEIPQVKIVRDGLRMSLDRVKGKPTSLGGGSALKGMEAQLRQAMLEVLKEQRESGTLPVKLRDPDRERLEAVAEAIGYTEPQQLIEDVMRNLLRRPQDIKEMLLGRALRDLEQVLQAEGQSDVLRAGKQSERALDEKLSAVNKPRAAKKSKAA